MHTCTFEQDREPELVLQIKLVFEKAGSTLLASRILRLSYVSNLNTPQPLSTGFVKTLICAIFLTASTDRNEWRSIWLDLSSLQARL
jgi:hypothetical protein